MKNLSLVTLSVVALYASITPTSAQDESELLESFLRQDTDAIAAIAAYPEDIRHAILEVAAHPELIVKLAGVQKESSDAFRALISGYNREEQQRIWNLVRFPELVDRLADDDIKSKKEIRALIKAYPKEIHADALDLGSKEYDLLIDISRLNRVTDQAFQQLVGPYPEDTRLSFERLVNIPEILSLLNDELQLTILLGDAYRRDPERVKDQARSLNLEIVRNNPDQTAEEPANAASSSTRKRLTIVEAAAQAYYARYTARAANNAADDTGENAYTEVTTYYHPPYPYWYGYPRFYRYPYGYPGFYAGLNWYITPHVDASIHLSPRLYRGRHYGYGYRHHYGYKRYPSKAGRHYRRYH